jgi:hypothetical protein
VDEAARSLNDMPVENATLSPTYPTLTRLILHVTTLVNEAERKSDRRKDGVAQVGVVGLPVSGPVPLCQLREFVQRKYFAAGTCSTAGSK